MKTEHVKIGSIQENEHNPRYISEDKFKRLVKSVKQFPEMLEARPIVVDENGDILGGNMRYRACKAAGLKTIPCIQLLETDKDIQKLLKRRGISFQELKDEFMIKDNASYGNWDWDKLANEFNTDSLVDWGLDVWQQPTEADYSILDEEDVSDTLDELEKGTRKAIQIEFELEHFDEAYELIKKWREKGTYIGGAVLEMLRKG